MVDCYTHLPGVVLRSDEPVPFDQGRLLRLSYDAWAQLDSDYRSDRHRWERFFVGEDANVFFHFQGTFGKSGLKFDKSGLKKTYRTVSARLERLHTTMLLATGARISDPLDSVTYLGVGTRLLGRYEREAILSRPLSAVAVTEEVAQHLAEVGAVLQVASDHPQYAEVGAGLVVLKQTARPEFSAMNELIHCATALEALLLPGVTREIKGTFSRRIAALCADDAADFERHRHGAAHLYKTRSQILHGNEPVNTPSRRSDDDLPDGRYYLCLAILQALNFLSLHKRDTDGLGALRVALDEAAAAARPFSWPPGMEEGG